MADSKRYLDWYKKAGQDLLGAKILAESAADNSLAAFHCQQAIEKMLKGYILKNRERLMEGHSLIFLIKQAAISDPEIKRFMRDCAFVNQFYIETRYPADVADIIEDDEMNECVNIAAGVIDYINSKE